MQRWYTQTFYNMFHSVLDITLETYWNKQWPETTILYNARGVGYIDIRDILNEDTDEQCSEMYNCVSHLQNLPNDEKVQEVLKIVNVRTTYKRDPNRKKMPEYWQKAYETFKDKEGDCEDGAILVYKLCRLLGVTLFRIKVVTGDVFNPDTNKLEGHCYVIYLSELYNRWFTIDWCYYFNDCLQNYCTISHSDNLNYRDIWWTTNEKNSWSQHNMMIIVNGNIVKL